MKKKVKKFYFNFKLWLKGILMILMNFNKYIHDIHNSFRIILILINFKYNSNYVMSWFDILYIINFNKNLYIV